MKVLHKIFEGKVLMSISAERGLLYSLKEFAEWQVAGDHRPHWNSIDEEPNQPFKFFSLAVGNGSANNNFLLTRIALKQNLEASQQQHGKCNSLYATERV